ncbi:MAG: hypothetical protein BGO96_09710 [Micrococcales bacterium 73-15]|nr:MAG: hypothetical protein BGO96_09710 [Micrococcales bacterium 73-15]
MRLTRNTPKTRHPWDPIHDHGHRYRGRAKGHVRKAGNSWYYEVEVDGETVAFDNTGHWRTIYDLCAEAVAAFDLVASVGHKLRPYQHYVDRANV